MRSLRHFLLLLAPLYLGAICSGTGDPPNNLPDNGSQLFTSPQVNPIALSCDGGTLYIANTTAGTLSVRLADPPFTKLKEIPVGLDPVGVAVRPKANCASTIEDEVVFVTNHISDTISVVSLKTLAVLQTIQLLDANGVSQTDEPVGVVFDGQNRAFATLDNPNRIVELAPDGFGFWQVVSDSGTSFTAQAPRALAVSGGRLYVASFESGNQSEFPSCASSDPRGFNPGDPNDEGCYSSPGGAMVTSPNIGGEVIHDGDLPDRDLFVYDTGDLSAPVDVIEGVGTLLYGVAASGNRIFVTNTDARNKLDGLNALGNRMFDNRLAFVDCNPNCGGVTNVDLDANAFGVPVPTPYGIAADDNGGVLVISVAGSDGLPADLGDPSTVNTDIPGLITVNSSGTVLGHVRTGAIPQGLALRSDGNGDAERAYVLNTVDSTLSIVNVSNPAAPTVINTISVGSDPTAPEVKAGRIAFSSARASTSGNFSCESCHPNGNIDQLLWNINMVEGPGEVPGCPDPSLACPEPRTTMPIRGLRNTLPLHWFGNLADPNPLVDPRQVEDDGSPDCNLAIDGEVGCIRHLVNASLSGVMCDPAGGCAAGPSGLPGALTDLERDDLAAFLAAVSYPPSPERRPDGSLSPTAAAGMVDLYTNQGSPVQACSDNSNGCHVLPLQVSTNSGIVGGFDAPTLRGLWDRQILFSNAALSSEEVLTSVGFDPKPGGMSERGSFFATFPLVFTPVYNVPADNIWALINEQSIGLPALAGRQVMISPLNANAPSLIAQVNQIEQAAAEGRITGVAYVKTQEYRFTGGLWTPKQGAGITGAALRQRSIDESVIITVTALLPARMAAGSIDRQPLIRPTPLDGSGANSSNLPIVAPSSTNATFTIRQDFINPGAVVLIDGALCPACSVVTNGATADVTLNPAPSSTGLVAMQVQNPDGFESNQLPICIGNNFNPCD